MSNPTELPDLAEAVRKLVKAKGRFHTEQNYKALAEALAQYDARRAQPEGEVWELLNELYRLNPTPEAQALIKKVDCKFELAAAACGKPEGEAPQTEPVGEVVLFGGDCKEISWAKGKLPPVGAKLYTHLPAATLSPLCGAQHAESGKEVAELPPLPSPYGTIPVYADDADGNQTHEVDGWTADQMRGYAIDYSIELDRAALAAQQAAAPGTLDWINDVVRDVCELIDRDSPAGKEDMMLVTVNELHDIIERHTPSAPGTPEARSDQLDAARYRYIRDTGTLDASVWAALEGYGLAESGELDQAEYAIGMDRAIDKARAAQLDGSQGEGQ